MRLSASNFRLVPVYNVLQDQHRFSCGEACDSILEVYDTAYPPFQLVFPDDMGIPSSVRLKKVCGEGTYFTNWANSVTRIEKDVDQDEVTEWWYTFQGGAFIGVPAGVYYVEITFPGSVLMYTETFVHPGNCEDCNEHWYLEYAHSCAELSLGDYSLGFVNKLLLKDIILYRDGEIESTISRKDGFGVETRIATDIRPKWTFEILGNSWLLDSLQFLKLYDQIYLKRSENSDAFKLSNIDVSPVGSNDDCFFPIKISFTKDVLENTKCCDSVYEQAPVPANCEGMHVMTSDNFQICLGDDATLVATVIGGAQPYVFIWSNGETGDTITVSPTVTTTYIITVIDAFGCVKQDTVTITVIECTGTEGFEVEIEASDLVVCEGTEVDLDATVTGGTGPFTYLWSTGATTEDISVTPSATTTYSIQVTDTATMEVIMAYITITVNAMAAVAIQSNMCFMSIAQIQECETIFYQWQIETAPADWDPAPGINNGTSYTGDDGENYRLQITCNGCIGLSNEITVHCDEQCTTEIVSVNYDPGDDELDIVYATVLGSTPFITGYLVINESATPDVDDCNSSGGWLFVISVTLTSESGTLHIPFVPNMLPGCISVYLNINAGECTDLYYGSIS